MSSQSTKQPLPAASLLPIPLGAARLYGPALTRQVGAALWLSHPAASGSLLTHPSWTSSPELTGVSGELRWEGKLYVFIIEASSRHREMGRAQPMLFHRAMRGCLVATAGFKMKKQCILLRVEMGTACSLLYKHQDSHSLGEETTAPKDKVCLLSHAFFTSSSHLSSLCPVQPR